MRVKEFVSHNFRHFNARALRCAAEDYVQLLESGGKMMVTMAGAMSTAELGKTLAPMIRQGYVTAISCTGANLEEDLFAAVAHDEYAVIPNYRDLTPRDEADLLDRGMNRVTDTCIPETEAMRKVESYITPLWELTNDKGESRFPHEHIYDVVLNPDFQREFQIPREHSWVLAAAEKNIPLFVPGWEDSTLGNFFVSQVINKSLRAQSMKSGVQYMEHLVHWYREIVQQHRLGFFQIGGGIAGDFPICAVPLITQDLKQDVPLWNYFCQITDAQESYGGYSGALPNEKITWGKLSMDTPKHVIHSDATIVAPLVFAYVLEHFEEQARISDRVRELATAE
jgi:deoxyhypusine synthase